MTVEADAPPASASNGELIRWSFSQLNKRDPKPLRRFWTDESLYRFPDKTCRGPAEIEAYFEAAFAALPDFHIELVDLAEEGEHVFAQWRLTGTHTGAAWTGIEPTGKPIALDGIDHFVLRDGQAVSNFVVYDQLQFARQVGMVPEDETGADRAMKAAFNAKNRLQAKLGL